VARKTRHPEHANHERWLVSYADFITLLFAFFVVMFATSHADKDKQKVVSAAVKEAINEGTFVTTIAGFLGKSKDNQSVHLREAKPYEGAPSEPKNPEKKEQKEVKTSAAKAAVVELLPSFQALSIDLEREIKAGKLDVSLEPRGLVVSMKEAAFFPAASDSINREAYPIIEKVADSIRKLENPVRLEGHTDSIPIRSKRFPSNWSLAAARSIAMLELLEQKFDVKRSNMAVAGYADTVPIAGNETDEGRAKNRRVDIIILNQFGLTSEPERVKEAQRTPRAVVVPVNDEVDHGEPPAKAPRKLPAKPMRKPSAAGPVKPSKAR
jgi:chemotaxis protein MotB